MDDALVFKDQSLIDSGAPATHVLLIGVGKYPCLKGGGGALAAEHGEMGQLSSPSVSAYTMAGWFLSHFNNPDKPLASLRLLVSGDSAAPFEHARLAVPVTPPAATHPNVQDATDAWFQLCDASEDHMAIFSFCGHGVARGLEGLTLLLEDYGASPIRPMDGALDFATFQRGMDRCAASQQCFFIDACRQVSEVVLNTSSDGQVLVQDSINRPYPSSRFYRVYYAAIEGEPAYGRRQKPSHFCEELINGLNGRGSHNQSSNGSWWVSTSRLQEWLQRGLTRRPGKPKVPGGQLAGGFDIHTLQEPPLAPAYVCCDDDTDNGLATFSCLSGNQEVDSRGPDEGEWLAEIPSGGLYDFKATIGTRVGMQRARVVMPPYIDVKLEVAP